MQRRGNRIGDGRCPAAGTDSGSGMALRGGQDRERGIAAIAVHADPAGQVAAQRILSRRARFAVSADQIEVRHHPRANGWRRDAVADALRRVRRFHGRGHGAAWRASLARSPLMQLSTVRPMPHASTRTSTSPRCGRCEVERLPLQRTAPLMDAIALDIHMCALVCRRQCRTGTAALPEVIAAGPWSRGIDGRQVVVETSVGHVEGQIGSKHDAIGTYQLDEELQRKARVRDGVVPEAPEVAGRRRGDRHAAFPRARGIRGSDARFDTA